MKNSFSVDVEDGISLAMRDFFGKKISQTDQVVKCTKRILEILEIHEVKATFFILGQVAENFPLLVKEISQKGHEIGVHGYNHLRIDKISQLKAKEELLSAKKILEDLTGNEVLGHRAPAFSIGPNEKWIFDLLVELGFKYDSSIMPINSFNYGWPNFNQDITKIKTISGNEIWEIPMNVTKIGNKHIPFSGGSYLRLLPTFLLKNIFKKEGNIRPVILYIHPYELDTIKYPDYYFKELNKLLYLKQLKIKSNWINRKNVENKLVLLIDNFNFGTIQSILDNAIKQGEYKKIEFYS